MHAIADLLVRIKNAYLVSHEKVVAPFSKMRLDVATVLKEQGYLSVIERKKKKTAKSEHEYLELTLSYPDGLPAMTNMRMISRPSRHMYVGVSDLKPVRSGNGVAVISTSQGIMSSKEARAKKIGGEILFEIW